MSGDCGGTNTRLVLFRVPAGVKAEKGKVPAGEVLLSKHYRNAENGSFTECCQKFLAEADALTGGERPKTCCLACASTIDMMPSHPPRALALMSPHLSRKMTGAPEGSSTTPSPSPTSRMAGRSTARRCSRRSVPDRHRHRHADPDRNAGTALQSVLGIPKVKLINDFEAQGYGLLTLSDSEVTKLNDATPKSGAPIACVGAGTGLGEC